MSPATDTVPLRALTVPEKRAVAMAARGIPQATITQHTRLTAEQIHAALRRAAQWEALAWRRVPRATPQPAPAPAAPIEADPSLLQRAVDLYAGGMTINQVSVSTGLTRAKVLKAVGLEAEQPRHLLPALEMPPVLQGVDGSIATRRPPVIAKPKTPAVPARPKPAPRPVPSVTRPPDEPPAAPAAPSPPGRPVADDAPAAEVLAVRLHQAGQPMADVCEATGLTLQEVRAALDAEASKRFLRKRPRPPQATGPAEPAAHNEVPEVSSDEPEARAPDLAASPKVRKWASGQGWQVPPPGVRLSGAIVLAYQRAHGDAS